MPNRDRLPLILWALMNDSDDEKWMTTADLRRMLERGVDVYRENVDAVMTASPKWIDQREMAVNALQQMSNYRITGMPVLNEAGAVTGSILMQDIYKAGIVR